MTLFTSETTSQIEYPTSVNDDRLAPNFWRIATFWWCHK